MAFYDKWVGIRFTGFSEMCKCTYIVKRKKKCKELLNPKWLLPFLILFITTVIQKTKINLHYNRCTVVVKNNKKNNMFPILAV